MEDFLTSFFITPFTGLAEGIATATSPLDVIDAVDGFVWGPIMILLLLGTHIFMTIRTGFIQRKISTGMTTLCYSRRTISGLLRMLHATSKPCIAITAAGLTLKVLRKATFSLY